MSVIPFQKYNESNNKIKNIARKYIDYYTFDEEFNSHDLRTIEEILDRNNYRAITTFYENTSLFKNLDYVLIGLVNYPPMRFTRRNIERQLNDIKNYPFIDEIEFPWNERYNDFDKNFWREQILSLMEHGIRMRPMLEAGVQTQQQIEMDLEFLNEIGIYQVMTSTGLKPQLTTIDIWKKIKKLFPEIFSVKIGGVNSLSDVKEFMNSDADLIATTKDIVEKEE